MIKNPSKIWLIGLLLIGLSFISLKREVTEVYVNAEFGYQIIKNDNQKDLTFCINAIENANWCGQRFLDERNLINFESGLEIELYSINEMNDSGNPVSVDCLLSKERNTINDIWKFSESGKIIHLVSKDLGKYK